MPEMFGDNEVGSPMQPCPVEKKPKPPHWIEIEMIGEDDQPIPWEEYEIKLPNGDTVEGYLDENGFARVESIALAGKCKVSFPALDADAWVRDGAPLTMRPPQAQQSGRGSDGGIVRSDAGAVHS